MVFKGPAGFQRVIYIVMNIVIGILIGSALTVIIMRQPITPTGLFTSTLTSFFIGYVVSDLIPAMAWGRMLAGRMGLRNNIAAHAVSSAVLAFFMGTFILLFMAIINVLPVGGLEGVIGFFVGAYLLVLVVAYVSILIFLPLATKLAIAISKFDPAQAPA